MSYPPSDPGPESPHHPNVFEQKPEHLSPQVQACLRRYWRYNVKLMIVLLLIWAFVGLGCGILFAGALNAYKIGGYPLGFWFAQQGSIITFVLLILIYAVLMNRHDKKHHEELTHLRAVSRLGQQPSSREDA